MKYVVAFILALVSLCDANHIKCRIFDQSTKSLEQYCQNFNGSVPENCSGEINPIDSSQVEMLKIRGCDPNFVLDTTKPFTNLRIFDISYSGFKNLDWLNLKLNRLQILNASHNELFNCRYDFRQTPDIVEIDLSHNQLERHTLPYFVELKKLKKLHLSYNNIVHFVDPRHFDAINLEYIDLKNNRLLSIPNVVSKKNFKVLHLEENPISYYVCKHLGQTSYPSLTSVYLSWKTLDFFGDSKKRCEGKRIRIVQDNANEGIFLTSNGKYEMHCKDECLENIFTFNAGRNAFENATEVIKVFGPKIRTMNLSGNFIGELNTNLFDRFFYLDTLNLSETNLTKLDFNMLRNNRRLSQVNMSNNKLKHLSNIQLLRDYRWQILDLGGNQIENMGEMIEYLNPAMEELDVSGNMVGQLKAATFLELPNLQRLNMKNTNLTLPITGFSDGTLQNLRSLDLSQNDLHDVIFLTLSTILYNLSELTLSDCRIQNISVVILHLGPSLRKLDLSNNFANNAQRLDNPLLFNRLENLEHLNLSGTNLLSLDSNLFKYQQNLEVLDLSNNKLKTFDLKILAINDLYTHRLNLEGNDLTELKNLHETNFGILCFKLASNLFPCPYLKQLSHSKNIILLDDSCLVNQFSYSKNIILLENSWLQKDGRDCRSTTQSINDFLSSVYGTVKFW